VRNVSAQQHRVLANDFAAQWAEIAGDAQAALDRVGRSGWLVLGEEVAAFEREIADWWGLPHAVGVASGLDAIEIALRLRDIGPGDRVVTTPLTAYATTMAILKVGAEPVWVDVDDTGGLDLARAREAILADPTVKALVPVHLFGHPLDPEALAAIAADTGVTVIEDCAQSAGARRGNAPTGRAGGLAATSLYPTKNLGALGDGGVLFTATEDDAERARRLRNYGQEGRYNHVELGLNSRLDEVHAAILRSALVPRLDGWLSRRAAIADRYVEGLRDVGALRPVRPADGQSANHLFPVEVVDGDRDAWLTGLAGKGIGVGIHYPFLCPDAPASAGRGTVVGELTTARRLAARELSLPLHPFMSDADADAALAACAKLAAA
jgi:dTDP-3-amino-3,4,6-trideoxy-alpha-D-glucose transaminase